MRASGGGLVQWRALRDIAQPSAVAISARTASLSVAVRLDEIDAVGEPVDLVGGGADGEARLAASAGPGQRDEPDVLVLLSGRGLYWISTSRPTKTDLRREVVRPEVERLEWRELSRQRRVGELEEALRQGPSADARRGP